MVKYFYFRFGKPGDGKEDTHIWGIFNHLREKMDTFDIAPGQTNIYISTNNDIQKIDDYGDAAMEMEEYLKKEGVNIDRVQGYIFWNISLSTSPVTPVQLVWLDDMYMEKEDFI